MAATQFTVAIHGRTVISRNTWDELAWKVRNILGPLAKRAGKVLHITYRSVKKDDVMGRRQTSSLGLTGANVTA